MSEGWNCAFDIVGDGNVTLEGVNTIASGRGSAGIEVIDDEALEITGTGSLTVTGAEYGAGIGTGLRTNTNDSYCGSVVISGGSVYAVGGSYGANIGKGAYEEVIWEDDNSYNRAPLKTLFERKSAVHAVYCVKPPRSRRTLPFYSSQTGF